MEAGTSKLVTNIDFNYMSAPWIITILWFIRAVDAECVHTEGI